MKRVINIVGIFLLYQSFLFANYQDDINKLDNLKLSYEYIYADDGTKLYYVSELLNKTNADVAGEIARSNIKSRSSRKKFYKQIIYKLIEDSSAKEEYEFSLEIYNQINKLGGSVLTGVTSTSGSFEKTLKFIKDENNNNIYSHIRKSYLKWGKNATFKNVKGRLDNLSNGLKTLNSSMGKIQKTLNIGNDIIKFLIMNSLSTGLLLDKIDLLKELDSKYDEAFTEVLNDISIELTSRNDDMVSSSLSILGAMYDKGELKLATMLEKVTKDIIISQATKYLFTATGLTKKYGGGYAMIFQFGVDELIHEFYDAPKLLKEHVLLTTLLLKNINISPLSKNSLRIAFTYSPKYENESSYKEFKKHKMKIYLYSMFFKNMKLIASDRGWVEALGFFLEKNLDRDKVKEVSKSLYKKLQDRFINLALESKYDIDVSTSTEGSDCYLTKAPLSINMTVKAKENDVNTNDVKVSLFVKDSNSFLPELHIGTSFYASKGGTYKITPLIMINNKKQILGETQVIIVKNTNVRIQDIEISNKNKFNYTLDDDFRSQLVSRWTPVFANYSDNTSGMINFCDELSLSIQDTSIATLTRKLYLNPKKEGSTELVAKLLNYEDRATISIFNIFRDVPSDKWYSSYVNELKDKKIVTGYDDKTFKPAKLVNVVEALTMVYRTVMKKTNDGDEIKVLDTYTIPYSDYSVKNKDNGWFFHALYFSSAIPLLDNPNVTNSKDRENSISFWKTDEFNPSGNLSRGEMAHMIANALHLEVKAVSDYKNNPFSDLSSTHKHYRWIMACYEDEIIGGYPNGSFKPDKQVNRAEMSKFVYFLYEKLDKDIYRRGR